MDRALFLQSLLIGLSIAAPVGPIGLLVIQRTLHGGLALGLATGLGAAVADAAYGALGAFGVSSVITLLQGARVPLALAGGSFLLWLARRSWRAAGLPSGAAAEATVGVRGRAGLAGAFAGTFFLTLSNPATILSFVAFFGVLAGQGVPASPWPMIAGVLLGSALWWLLLCAAVGLLRERLGAPMQRTIGRVSALLLAGFALWALGLAVAGAGAGTGFGLGP